MSLADTVPKDAPSWFKNWVDGIDKDNIFGTALFEHVSYTLENAKKDFIKLNERMDKMNKKINDMATKDDIKKLEKLIKNNHS